MTPQDQLKPQPVDMSLREYIDTYGEKIGVPKPLRDAIFQNESGFEHYDRNGKIKRSSAGALGVGQLMPATARNLGVDINDPIQNAYGALRLQKTLYEKYLKAQGDPHQAAILAAAAYNSGEPNVDKYNGVPPFAETQGYVKRVAAHLKQNPIQATSQRPIVQPQPEPVPQRLNPVLPGYESVTPPPPAQPVAPQKEIVPQPAVEQMAQQRIAQAQRRRAQQQMQARVQQARAAQSGWGKGTIGQGVKPVSIAPKGISAARVEGKAQPSEATNARMNLRRVTNAGGITGGLAALLPTEASDWINEAVAQGAGQLLKAAGGIGTSRLALSPITSATEYLANRTGVSPSRQLKQAGQQIGADVQALDEDAKRGFISSTAKDLVAGSIGSSPAMILTALGVPAPLAFGMQANLEAEGSDASFKDVAKETVKGATIGALFELPMPAKLSLLQRLGYRVGTVGGGTFGLEKLSGADTKHAATSAFINGVFAGTGAGKEKSALSRGLDREIAREQLREPTTSPITPEVRGVPEAIPEAPQAQAAPEVGTVKVGEPVSHPNPEIDGKPIIAKREDGRVVVANENNPVTGVSVVKHQPELPALPELPETAPSEVRAARERQVEAVAPTAVESPERIAERQRIALGTKRIGDTYVAPSAPEPTRVDQFVESLSPANASKARAALDKQMRFNGEFLTRREYVEQAVNDGARVVTVNGERRLQRPDGSYLPESSLSKTGMDYAQQLESASTQSERQVESATPATPEPQGTPFNQRPQNEIGLNDIQQAEWDKVLNNPENYGGQQGVEAIIERSRLSPAQKEALRQRIAPATPEPTIEPQKPAEKPSAQAAQRATATTAIPPKTAKKAREILDAYENTGELSTEQEVVKAMEKAGMLPEAVAAYRRALVEDRELGMRMDVPGETFEKEVLPKLRALAEGTLSTVKPAEQPKPITLSQELRDTAERLDRELAAAKTDAERARIKADIKRNDAAIGAAMGTPSAQPAQAKTTAPAGIGRLREQPQGMELPANPTAEPSTVTAARKRLAKTEKPNLKDFLKSEKGEFDPQILVDHLIVHGYDAYQAGKVKFEDWANEMRGRFKDFKEEIEPHLKDVYAKLTKPTEAEAKPRPEAGIERRRLPQTLEAAQMEEGNKLLYFPKSIIEGAEGGRKILEEKGLEGAVEHVLHGEPGIDWASTGFATLNEMRVQETRLRDSGDITAADALRKKKEDFAGEFSERATRLGQGIAGVKAIEEFAPDRAAYIANKASQKGRGKPLSVEEEKRITTAGERLGELKARERANEAALNKAKAKVKPAAKKESYQDKLEAEAQKIVLTLKPKIGKLNLGSLGTFKVGERGAVRTRVAPLEGDAELIAKYAASRLNKIDTVDALNKELTDMFGPELEPYLSPIRQRAYEIRGEARRAEIASRDTEPKQRRTILKEIQKEISDTRKSLEEAKTEQKVQAKTELGVYRKGEAEGKAEFAREARKRLDQLREEYKVAAKAEREGYRKVIRAQREAARTAKLWDTPLRDAATEAKTRLANADPKSPDTVNDLVSVGTEKFLNEKIGGTGRIKPINPSQFYADMKAEYPNLVTKKNQAEIYKRSYERIKDAASAAREAAKQRTASAESQRLWDELGIDKDAQALLIERSEIARQQLEERTKMVREFDRVSQPLWKKGLFEGQALARALKSSIDAPTGRQGLVLAITHPIETVRYTIPATLKGYSALRHGTYTERVIEQQAHPDYDLGRRAGLDLTELASAHDPRIKAEEQFQSTLAEKIPHVRLSEQGFILGMNEARLQAFSRFADAGRAQGYTWESNPKFFKEVAELVNDMTGRGHMSENVQKFSSSVGNWLFYSTRLNVSRIQLLNDFLNPKKYLQYDPVTRKLMAQDLARLTLGMAGIYLGAKAMGFGVTMNPNDPDFGKVRVGKTHYDVTGGEAGTIRFLFRLAAGTLKLGAGQPVAEQDSPSRVAVNFLRQKLAPVPGTVVDYLAGSDITGQPKNFSFNQPQLAQRNILINMVTPMVVNDLMDAFNEEGWKGVGKNIPAIGGVGIQNYLATPEVSEVRRRADVLNQTKKKTEGEFDQEVARTKLGRAAAELNKMSAEAKKAPTTAERDKILNEMKRIAAQSLIPTTIEKERLSKIDPQVRDEMKRLKTEGFSGEVNLPDNELKLGGKTIPLTDQQWEQYSLLFTEQYYRLAKNVMSADTYKNATDEIKRKRFERARNIAHQSAKLKMKQQLDQVK